MAPLSAVDADLLDRIARLETNISHMSVALERNTEMLETLNNVLQQARGAKWALMLIASIAGFLGSKIGAVLGFMAGLPKRPAPTT